MLNPDSSASSAEQPRNWDDAGLARALAESSEAAFREIYERYWLILFKVAWRKLNDREAARETVQEVFEGLWQKPATSTIEHLPSYRHTAVKYRIINCLRAEYHRRHYLTRCRCARAACAWFPWLAGAATPRCRRRWWCCPTSKWPIRPSPQVREMKKERVAQPLVLLAQADC